MVMIVQHITLMTFTMSFTSTWTESVPIEKEALLQSRLKFAAALMDKPNIIWGRILSN